MLFSQWRHVMNAVCLSSVRPGGVFCEVLGGGVPRGHWNPYLNSGTYPYSLYYGCIPGGFEVFCIRESGCTSNARFCMLEVWQDFIRVAVLRLLSRSKNFHSSKHKTNSSIWDLVWIERRGHNDPTQLISRIVVFCCEAHWEILCKPKRCEP